MESIRMVEIFDDKENFQVEINVNEVDVEVVDVGKVVNIGNCNELVYIIIVMVLVKVNNCNLD